MTSIITNTSPVIALSIINKFSLLWDLFDNVYVPEAVLKELTSSLNEDDFGKKTASIPSSEYQLLLHFI